MPGFMEIVQQIWAINCPGDSAKCISSKFKLLRKGLKKWSTSILVINKIIDNCNTTILMLDCIIFLTTKKLTGNLVVLLDGQSLLMKTHHTFIQWLQSGFEKIQFPHWHVTMDQLLGITMRKPEFYGILLETVLGSPLLLMQILIFPTTFTLSQD
jgi:hypothetical protein